MQAKSGSKYKYLFTNIIAFLCGNIGTKMIGFLMVPMYTNILLPEEYGEIDLILSVAGMISPFVACGIHEGIMRFALDKDADHSLVLSIGLRFFSITSIAFLLICALLKAFPIIGDNAWFLYGYCVLNELMTIMLCYIRGCDNTRLYSFLGFLSALFTALLNILFLVVLKMGLNGYKVSMLLSPVCTMVIAFLMGRVIDDIHLKKWNSKLAREMLSYSLILIPNALLWWCINASDRFFVSYMCGTAENGLYAVSYKLPTLLSTVASIFMQAWQMSAIKEHEEQQSGKFSQDVYEMLTVIMGGATMVLMLLNRPILLFYVGSQYQEAWIYSPPLMMSFFVGAFGTFWGSFYIAEKKMGKYLTSAIAGAVVNIALNYGLISLMGTIGAAIATLISYVIVMIVRAIGIQKKVQIPFINKYFVSTFVCSFIVMAATYLPMLWTYVVGGMTLISYITINRSQFARLLKLICRR